MITNDYIYNIPWLPNDYYNIPSNKQTTLLFRRFPKPWALVICNFFHQIWGPYQYCVENTRVGSPFVVAWTVGVHIFVAELTMVYGRYNELIHGD